jgi:hypothetical protein
VTTTILLVLLGTLTWIRPASVGPGRARADRLPRDQSAQMSSRRPSGRQLELCAAVGVGAVAVLIAGLATGAIIGLVAGPLAVVGVRRLAAMAPRIRPDIGLALAVDLAACALRAGQPVATAVALAAPAAGPVSGPRLLQVSGLLRLGAEPAEAWRELLADPVLAPVAQAARRSATSGARLAQGWEQLAVELRAGVRSAAEARAHRAGVFAMAPLGLCFLPAFVCLGVIPVVIGIARTLPAIGGP